MSEMHQLGEDSPGDPSLVELSPTSVAAGGSCITRYEDRVVFVRHTLPGEKVVAQLTQADPAKRWWQADAIEVKLAAPQRVSPPCPYAYAGGCGGCDWQHADIEAQREFKADVIIQQLRRIGQIDLGEWALPPLAVQPLTNPESGRRWRLRMRFTANDNGRLGLLRHNSHQVIEIAECLIAHQGIAHLGVAERRWPFDASIEVAVSETGDHVVMCDGQLVPELSSGSATRHQVTVAGQHRRFRVSGTGFWQVHTAAAQAFSDAITAQLSLQPGDAALDLYSGVGLFAAGLGAAVTATGAVLAMEANPQACADAKRNLHDLPQITIRAGAVGRDLRAATRQWLGEVGKDRLAAVVLDPPRTGAGAAVMRQLAELAPDTIAYLSCDAATLARDLKTVLATDYRLSALQAFDAFPMTHHAECLAILRHNRQDDR